MLAYTASGWTQVVVGLSIFVPVVVTIAITILVLRGAKNDPDEQRFKRLAEQRRLQDRTAGDGGGNDVDSPA